VLLEREKISTTAIGEGVAIPHGKLPGVERVLGVFARSPQGVDFASLDGGPTHLFFVLVAPENAAADHLKALARISRLLKDEPFRRRLMVGQTSQELFNIIAEEDEKF
jgi:PTS system nitrogen regulatory IIA component